MQLAGSYWQADCVMPLGQMYWVLAVQVGTGGTPWQDRTACAHAADKITSIPHSFVMHKALFHAADPHLSPRVPAALPAATHVQCAGFMLLAVYLDAVLPDANGVRRPPWFFLLPGYWWRGSGVSWEGVVVVVCGWV